MKRLVLPLTCLSLVFACSDDGTPDLVPTSTLPMLTETGDPATDTDTDSATDTDTDSGDGDGDTTDTATAETDSGDGDGDGPLCGNGVVEEGEECDDGNAVDDDECSNACVEQAVCGNGLVEEGEECDDANDNNDDSCTNDCMIGLFCGNGVVDEGEECDVGEETMFCDGDCTFTVCGDGYHNMLAEQCDDGNSENNDECVGPCLLNVCGDGYLYEGMEECDDDNLADDDDCTSECVNAFCGDGIVHADDEECDDANMVDNDACTAMCTASFCGDGVIWEGMETCDDGNMENTDACPNCQPAFCGDGFVQAGVEECDDGNDVDDDFCSNSCVYVNTGLSCKDILDQAPNAPSGVYPIDPDGNGVGQPGLVWCDMDTDGGGWTLVGSTRTTTFNDQASPYYADLQTVNPEGPHEGIWDGMRPLAAGNADIRFSCMQDPDGGAMDVDLSFYNIIWYGEITTGADADSCFSESNGNNDDQPTPARRNNLNDEFLMAGDQWTAGYLEGEDSCTDTGDFTVDFDDRGMDSNQSDGTDWGEDDSSKKCGQTGQQDGAWHIWVREL